MYREYFGFREKPFGLTPDSRFLFLSQNHREGFAHLWYGIHQGGGFVVLSGEVGTGKTTLLRSLLSRLESSKWRSALIFNPPMSPEALFRDILLELGLQADEPDPGQLMRRLNAFLLKENSQGRSVLLVIDEAQNLCPEVLEKIRLLSNLETEKRKLLHILLAGQPELVRLLDRQELRQLRQRVSVHYHLQSMSSGDTRRYIEHRLAQCGAEGPVFSPRAMTKVFRFSEGIPRLINILCDRCLLAAFGAEKKMVTRTMVGRAAEELKPIHRPRRDYLPGTVIWLPLFLGLFVLAASWGLFHLWGTRMDRSSITAAVSSTGGTGSKGTALPGPDPLSKIPDASVNSLAFKAMGKVWGVSGALTEGPVETIQDFALFLQTRGLQINRVRGSLSKLLDLNYPFLMVMEGRDGRRLAAVCEEIQGTVRVVPPVEGRDWVSLPELSGLWKGEGFLVWRNDLRLAEGLVLGDRGDQVKALQELLLVNGEQEIQVDGIFGRNTSLALRNFQTRRGLENAEKLDMITLLFLYQAANRFGVPKLREG
ncbi:MAG: AAA family ATPase [Syntrophotaleaceae bacterium]